MVDHADDDQGDRHTTGGDLGEHLAVAVGVV